MNEREHPRDDNLRRILAESHAEWLHERIAATKRRIAVVLVVLALALLLLAGTLELGSMSDSSGGLFTELFVVQLLAFAALPVCGVEAARSYLVLRGYQASLVDHRDFLRHYNRI
jgi:hypothetical protein